MPFINPTTPNLTDFLTFLTDTVQIPTTALPSGSAYPGYALNQAIDLVLLPPVPPGILYVLACYNCATHLLFAITPDQPGQTYFTTARSRTGFGLALPPAGFVVTSSDQGTSSSSAKPVWAEGLTVSQLGFMRTPYGREYLTWQQSYGPTIVDLT